MGIYFGNNYNIDANDPSPIYCAWTPSQIQDHYGLTAAYKKDLDGTGQTIVIVDGPTDGAQLTTIFALFS